MESRTRRGPGPLACSGRIPGSWRRRARSRAALPVHPQPVRQFPQRVRLGDVAIFRPDRPQDGVREQPAIRSGELGRDDHAGRELVIRGVVLGKYFDWNSEIVSPADELDDPVVLALLRALLQNNAAGSRVDGRKTHRHVIDEDAISARQPFEPLASEISPVRQDREVVVDHHGRRSCRGARSRPARPCSAAPAPTRH